MAEVIYEAATRIYPGSDTAAIEALELEVEDGEFMVLVGPSGSGKSTALRMLAGLEPVDAGAVRIGDRDVTNVPAKERDIAMVFQSYALYPHMTVSENMAFALKQHRVGKTERMNKVREAARILDLEPLLDRKPKQLSGGQRQRVAMGRAIVREPQVFLMDEPLSNLDAKLRVQTRAEIASLQARLGVTTVYVTHDQVEAMTMGDRVAVLRDGVLQQCDTPRALYERPANLFVAGFIGSPAMNILDCRLVNGEADLAGNAVSLPAATTRAASVGSLDRLVVGIRPEDITVVAEGQGIPAIVELVEELGADAFFRARISDRSRDDVLTVRTDAKRPPRRGDRLSLRLETEHSHLFNQAGERLEIS